MSCSARQTGYGSRAASLRPVVLGLAKLLFLPLVSAAPHQLWSRSFNALEHHHDDDLPKDADDVNLWIYLGVAAILVLLGGAFAGLTIALMGQDETYLQVIAESGEGGEKKSAEKVLKLLNRGKHWVLVTLLLSNVITNETLPIVLDRSLGGGWPAVVGSTVLIVIFGEVVPQSICVRYGLGIGSFMAPVVLGLMWLMSPVAWPTAKLLDYLLGEEHGTMYNKPGLKTLVTLHRSLGSGSSRLMEDEVTIINSVLDLKDKLIGTIMTPMGDVFTMSADTVLDEKMMDTILSQGYSRIPIYNPENPRDFIGMLLVKILITYDPEDCKRVKDFSLATLPETAPHTSCLDIINFFQEGKSHMVLVSDFPGQDKGALGVVTLEDVIEELIGEEIIDESDVFIDVHKAIRRLTPAPRTKVKVDAAAAESDTDGKDGEETPLLNKDDGKDDSGRKPSVPNTSTFLMRRRSSGGSDSTRDTMKPLPIRGNATDLRQQLKSLGPSNLASKPRSTKYTSVKIKPGVGTIPENGQPVIDTNGGIANRPGRAQSLTTSYRGTPEDGEGAGLLRSAGAPASDGVATLQAGYGTMSPNSDGNKSSHVTRPSLERGAVSEQQKSTSADPKNMTAEDASKFAQRHVRSTDEGPPEDTDDKNPPEAPSSPLNAPPKLVVGAVGNGVEEEQDDDTVGQMGGPTRDKSTNRRTARSGSITETTIDVNGTKKLVLETTSSSSDQEENSPSHSPRKLWNSGNNDNEPQQTDGANDGANESRDESPMGTATGDSSGQKKKKKKKGKKKAGNN